MRLRAMASVGCALGLGVLFALSLGASPAAADPPVYVPSEAIATEPPVEGLLGCSEDPAAPEGEAEPVVAELRRLRIEAVATCEAVLQRLDLSRHRLWWIVAEALEAGSQRSLGNEKLTALVEALAVPREVTLAGVGAESPLPVRDALATAGSGDVTEAVNASGEASTSVAWYIAGLIVACFLGYVIYRQVMPRA